MNKYILAALICSLPGTALAEAMVNDDVLSVKERESKDFEPLGTRVGAFMLYSGLNVDLIHDDNIFRDNTNEESDLVTVVEPSLELKSNWSRHSLRFFTNADIGLYADNDDENYEDFSVGADGRYDITHKTYLYSGLRLEKLHEGRDSPDDVNGDEPTEFDVWSGRAGFVRALAKLQLFIEGRFRDTEYDDAQTGGTTIDNSFRNHTQYEGDVKLAYELSPNYEMFLRGVYDKRSYDETTHIMDRSSDGYRVEAGTDINISGKVKAQIHGGYITRDYGAGFKGINTEDYGANLLWNINGLTSFVADLDRRVIETTATGVSGYIRTQGSAAIEHAFAENFISELKLTYIDDEFVGSTRADETWRAGLSFVYKPFRGAKTGLYYDYTDRNSNQINSDFQNHRLTFRLGYTF